MQEVIESMPDSNPQLDPGSILRTAFAFWSSKVLLTAVEFGLFTRLGDHRITGAELGAELGLHQRGIGDFFDALVAMQFLGPEGDGASAKYHNTPATALYLDSKSPRYIGGILVMLNARLFRFMGAMTGLSRINFEAFAAKFDFSNFKAFVMSVERPACSVLKSQTNIHIFAALPLICFP